MVKQPGRLGGPPTGVTWLGQAPSNAQCTAAGSLVQEVPMGQLPRWGVADQGNLTGRHVVQATGSSSSVPPLVVLGLFLGLSAKLDPFQPSQLASKQGGDNINGFEVFLSERR